MVRFEKIEPRTSTLAALLSVALLFVALAVQAASEQHVYQETDKTAPYYLANRRALVGNGCVVSSLFDGVKVVGGVANLGNLVNDDLSDYASFPSLADVGVAVEPLVSVRDLDHAYAAGTEVGFSLEAASGAELLSLDISKFFVIYFYRKDVYVGQATVSQGQDVKGLNLSLIQIPGNSDFTKDIVATAPAEFDEIKLVKAGVDVSALGSVNIRYAFVGKAREYTLTESSMKDYAAATGRNGITVTGHGGALAFPGELIHEESAKALVDDDLTNSFVIEAGIIYWPATVVAKASDGNETFKAGTEVGFRFSNVSVLDLSVLKGIKLHLYDAADKEVGNYTVSVSVLGLAVAGGNSGGFVIKAPVDFSSVRMNFEGVTVNLGEVKANYAFVRLAPDIASHHCPIDVMADRSVCDCNNVYYLNWNKDIPVTWSIVEQPSGSDATVDANGKVTLSVPGLYRFKATAEDGCSETTTLGYGNIISYDPAKNGEKIIENYEDGTGPYALSDKLGGGLIQIMSGVKNRRALLTPTLRDFAYTQAGLSVVNDNAIVGVKTKDGSNMADGYNGKIKAGFVVALKNTALSADVLNTFNVRIYKGGKLIEDNLTKHWNAINARLIGDGQTQKVRLSVDVPAGTDFDELVLWKTGVLSVDLSQMNVYYAFVDDGDKTIPSEDGLYQADIISHDGTNASIDYANSGMFSVANVGNGINNIANLIDGDLTTGVDFPYGANLGGATLAVNLGRIADEGQQLVVVMDKAKFGLGVKLGNVLKIETYLGGEKQEELTSWRVLGADVIGDGGQAYAILNPTKSFDQVRIVPIDVLTALSNIKLYGIALRNDANGDGIPDVVDESPCERELVLDEDHTLDEAGEMQNVRLVLHRTLSNDSKGAYTWNSIILPVSLTRAQMDYAFGSDTKLAVISRVEDNWIYFKEQSRPADDNAVELEKDKPYLIMPSKDAVLNNEAKYEALDGREVSGPIYFVTDVSYAGLPDMTHGMDGTDKANVTFTGSYTNPSVVEAGAYMLSKGDMVHTAVEHKIKAYRCWLTTDAMGTAQASAELKMRVASLGGSITGITSVEERPAASADGVFDLGGRRMATSTATILPKGVYVIGGKKTIVK